ncbi:MAG: hypothetical protein Q8K55_00460 [Gemmatimonadaceae bacterium]|nr:hypothetical protein [Gemmatimonadaceae bacterium]
MRFLNTVALLAVCAAGAAAQGQLPLDATLRRGSFEPLFYVDQPAYVAVFEVIPGQGVQQIFPRSATQASKPVEPGEYLLSRPFRSQIGYDGWSTHMPYARPMYMLDNRGRIVSYYYTTGWTGDEAGWGAAGPGPARTLLLVASRAPLRRVSSPDAARQWLQQVVGFRAISSTVMAPQSMLTDIVDAVIPTGTSLDDVVVDVLEVYDFDTGTRRWMGQSITFACPGGLYSVPAQYFFASGTFYCPMAHPYADTPAGPVPADTTKSELLQPKARKVPPKYVVEEGAVLLPGGIRTNTPVMSAPPGEEGYRPYRRAGGTAEEGFRPYSRGVGTTETTRATITLGAPIIPEGVQPARLIPSTGAWVPPIPGAAPSDYGYGAGRFTPSGSYGGYGTSAGGSANRTGEIPSHSTAGSSSSSASSSATTSAAPSAPPSQTPSQAASERGAAARAEISAARAAGTKPNPDR